LIEIKDAPATAGQLVGNSAAQNWVCRGTLNRPAA